MLANEVADALPCRRFTWRDGALRELGVALAEAAAVGGNAVFGEEISFREQCAAADAPLARACEALLASLEAALAANLTLSGFATQAGFLLAGGLEALVAEADDSARRARLAGEARRLVLPEEMGEAFKFMALTRGYDSPLSGFALQDLRHLL